MMQFYLVGGAVRDKLLKLPVTDRDWVVVGSSPETMLAQGYQAVGQDFPVFLHPETHEEYALARTERKSGHGYTGFTFYTSPDVTLEEDLARRDLTINAIAMSATSEELIDPFGGVEDLNNKVLRHVSPAFSEDPLRVLRVARFAARFTPLGFRVAEETQVLMTQMVEAQELEHLTAERVWLETHKALHHAAASTYFLTLQQCGALQVVMPELQNLFDKQASKHPVLPCLSALDRACLTPTDADIRFAVLVQDIEANAINSSDNANHSALKTLCDRLKVPNPYRDLGRLCQLFYPDFLQIKDLNASQLCHLLERLDIQRRRPRFEKFLIACQMCITDITSAKAQTRYLERAAEVYLSISPKLLVAAGFKGKALGERIKLERLQHLEQFLKSEKC